MTVEKRLDQTSQYYFKEIGDEYNDEMLSIMEESPIQSGGFRIVFDRSPNFFTIPRLTSYKIRCGGFFDDNELLGFAMALFQRVYIYERPGYAMYFASMYVKEKDRRKGFTYEASNFFHEGVPAETELMYGIMMSRNDAALRTLNRFDPRYPHMPFSKIIGQLDVKNILITTSKKESKRYKVRHATLQDVDAIVELLAAEHCHRLFAPVINSEIFLDNLNRRPGFSIHDYYVAESSGEIVGVCSAWDMSPVKRNKVISYGLKFGTIRFFYNLMGIVLGYPLLPPAGEPLRDVTILEYAAKGRQPDTMNALLTSVYNEYRRKGYNLLIFGSSADDPLLDAAGTFFSQSVVSHIVLSFNKKAYLDAFHDTSIPYINLALL